MPRGKTSRRTRAAAPARVYELTAHLTGLSTAVRLHVRRRLAERGHQIPPASTQILPNLPRDGLGMSELAARLRITLQRTGQLVQKLEEAGYVERIPDEADGRAKRVVYSRKGRGLLADIDGAMAELDDDLTAALGARRLRQLGDMLGELDTALNGETDGLLLLPTRRR